MRSSVGVVPSWLVWYLSLCGVVVVVVVEASTFYGNTDDFCVTTTDHSGIVCYPLETVTSDKVGDVCLQIIEHEQGTALQVSYQVSDLYVFDEATYWWGTNRDNMPKSNVGIPLLENFPEHRVVGNGFQTWTQTNLMGRYLNCAAAAAAAADNTAVTTKDLYVLAHAQVTRRSDQLSFPTWAVEGSVSTFITNYGYIYAPLTCDCTASVQNAPPPFDPSSAEQVGAGAGSSSSSIGGGSRLGGSGGGVVLDGGMGSAATTFGTVTKEAALKHRDTFRDTILSSSGTTTSTDAQSYCIKSSQSSSSTTTATRDDSGIVCYKLLGEEIVPNPNSYRDDKVDVEVGQVCLEVHRFVSEEEDGESSGGLSIQYVMNDPYKLIATHYWTGPSSTYIPMNPETGQPDVYNLDSFSQGTFLPVAQVHYDDRFLFYDVETPLLDCTDPDGATDISIVLAAHANVVKETNFEGHFPENSMSVYAYGGSTENSHGRYGYLGVTFTCECPLF